MNVWIFQTGEPLHVDTGSLRPMRAMSLADELISQGHQVVLWSSSFFHQEKTHRSRGFRSITVSENLVVNLIPSRGYRSNIGLGRLIDHIELGKNLSVALQNSGSDDLPDAAFIGFPPIEFAYSASRFLHEKEIPYMLDAKDMWPDYFVEKIPGPLRFMGRFLFNYWFKITEYVFKNAAGFSTISDGYLKWMYKVSKRQPNEIDCVAPTSTSYTKMAVTDESMIVSQWKEKGVLIKEHKIIFYAGTINKTLDFDAIMYVARKFAVDDRRFKFVICGDGPEKKSLQQQFNGLDNVLFTGWISKSMLYVLAKGSMASLIPYRNSETFSLGIPNKFSDALAIGVPIISCLDGEVKNLIDDYEIGIYYPHNRPDLLLSACSNYLNSTELFLKYSKNARKLYKKRFDFSIMYKKLGDRLINLAVSHMN